MMRIFKQPLVQFLLGGFVLYLLLVFASPDEGPDDSIIVVDDGALLTYLQFQDKAFDESQARQILGTLDAEARARLIEEYVRNEVMVREAFAMGLDQNDDVIRQRLIQKMDFLFQGFVDDTAVPSEQDQQAYFAANQDQYQQPAQATFTHIFFNSRNRERELAKADAEALLETLNADQVPFEDAGRYGDRFFFLRNYVNRSEQLITDHFGPEMTAALFAAEPGATWVGPFSSRFGEHLVMVRSTSPARGLTFEEAQDQVLEGMRRERRDEARRKAYEERAENYSVEIIEQGGN